MKKVAVVDYGMGNLRSVTQAVMHVAADAGVEVVWARSAKEVMDADRVVLPGQGGMRDCMQDLHACGMFDAVMHAAANKPLMPGEVIKFELAGQLQADGSRYKVPQMGWNQVWQTAHGVPPHPVWGEVPNGSYFYFVHSYYAKPYDISHSVGETDYGSRFSSAIARDNIFATQFHPEKSAEHGLSLYRNFLHWNP